jgi:hypothetical protein
MTFEPQQGLSSVETRPWLAMCSCANPISSQPRRACICFKEEEEKYLLS